MIDIHSIGKKLHCYTIAVYIVFVFLVVGSPLQKSRLAFFLLLPYPYFCSHQAHCIFLAVDLASKIIDHKKYNKPSWSKCHNELIYNDTTSAKKQARHAFWWLRLPYACAPLLRLLSRSLSPASSLIINHSILLRSHFSFSPAAASPYAPLT